MFRTVKRLFGRDDNTVVISDPGEFVQPVKGDRKRKGTDRRKRNEAVSVNRRQGERRAKHEPVVVHAPTPPAYVTEIVDAIETSLLQTGTDGGRVVSIAAIRRSSMYGDGNNDNTTHGGAKGLVSVVAPVSTQPVHARLSPAVAASSFQTVNGHGVSAATKTAIATENDLVSAMGQRWRGMLAGVVNQDLAHQCVALDVMAGQVVIILTEEVNRNNHLNTVRRKIEDVWSYKITNTFVLPAPLVDKIYRGILTASERGDVALLTQDSRLLQVFDDIIELAIQAEGSDLHFESYDGEAMVRLRVAGYMHRWLHMSETLMLDCLSAAFGGRYKGQTSNKPNWSVGTSLAFITEHDVNGQKWNGRYDGGPHSAGYKAVMRLLDGSPRIAEIPTVAALGYQDSQLEQLELALSRQWGIFLAIGGTGQGKSTLLRAVLVHLPGGPNLAISTIESPVEYKMPGVFQYNAPVDVGLSNEKISQMFTGFLRNMMRQDPDVLMVGEIRDHETAELAIEFAMTDKRSFSTLHAGGCINALTRLTMEKLQIPADTLGNENLVNCLVYQKLLPKLCRHCRIQADDPEHGLPETKRKLLLSKFDLDPKLMYVEKPGGCAHCRPKVAGLEITGTVGRCVAAEIFMPTPDMLPLIAQKRWPELTRMWRSTRKAGFSSSDTTGKTAYENGLYHVAKGDVSLRHFEKQFERIESYFPQPITKGNS